MNGQGERGEAKHREQQAHCADGGENALGPGPTHLLLT